jgi:hypothetical protein
VDNEHVHARARASTVVLFDDELGDLDDGFHGLQRGLAQDPAAILLVGWRVEGLEADDPFEAVLEPELLQDRCRMGLVRVGEKSADREGAAVSDMSIDAGTQHIQAQFALAHGN